MFKLLLKQKSAKMTSKYINLKNIQLHCKVAGEGPLMILLHGFPEFWYAWRKQIPVLAQKYTVVAPDMRGYNESEKPKGIKNYRMELLVDDIRQLIAAFGQEKAIIVGHDWGGVVAWTLASYFPESVEQLIVLNMPNPAEMKKQLRKNPRQLLRSWYMGFFQIPMLPELYLKTFLPLVFKQTFKGWAYNPDAFSDEDVAKYVESYRKKDVLSSTINYYRAVRFSEFENGRKPQKVPMPVLLLFGENDKALGKELTYNTYNYCSGELKVQYVKNCSHWIQHEYPDLVNTAILDFLEKHR